jgi:hypothetical protein
MAAEGMKPTRQEGVTRAGGVHAQNLEGVPFSPAVRSAPADRAGPSRHQHLRLARKGRGDGSRVGGAEQPLGLLNGALEQVGLSDERPDCIKGLG